MKIILEKRIEYEKAWMASNEIIIKVHVQEQSWKPLTVRVNQKEKYSRYLTLILSKRKVESRYIWIEHEKTDGIKHEVNLTVN